MLLASAIASSLALSPINQGSAADQANLLFVLEAADGTTRTGPLIELASDWSVQLGGEKSIQVSGTDLIELRRSGKRLPPKPTGEHLLFANGDCLPGTVVGLAGERIRFRSDLAPGKELEIPLDTVTLVWRAAPDGVEKVNRFRRQLAAASRTHDRVLLQNGDTVEGVIKGISENTVEIESEGKPISLDRSKLAIVVMSTELINSLRPMGPYGRLLLDDGTRLSLLSCEWKPGGPLAGKTLFGASVRVPAERFAALSLYQAKAVYLSDVKPSGYEFAPFLDLRWNAVMDGNVLGDDLVLAGSVYDKGIGQHSASRLTYNLDGAYQRFESVAGLDALGGTARVQVRVDGKAQPLERDGELGDAASVLPIRVKVAGARTLTLAVEIGRRGDVLGRVNWANARLVK